MPRSKQRVTSSWAKSIKQQSDATDASQTVDKVRSWSIEQRVESGVDLAALARELATLRTAMRQAASTREQDVAIGAVAAAEKAASECDERQTFHHLKSAGKWALEVSEKVGIGVAIAAIKYALGM